jgi:hypothetical protein
MIHLFSFRKIFLFSKFFFKKNFSYKKKVFFPFNKKKNLLSKKNILYFLPEAGLDDYVETQIKISNYLKKLKYNIVFIRCQKFFNKCQFKNALKLNYGLKNKILGNLACEVCIAKSLIKFEKFDFNIINLYGKSSLINIKNINNKYFNSNNIYDFIKYRYLGIEIAKLALYDFFIDKRKINLKEVTAREINELRLHVIDAIKAIDALKNIKKKYNFNYIFLRDEFSMMSAISLWCKNKKVKVKVFRIEGAYLFNYSYKYISILKSRSVSEERKYLINQWSYFKDLPLKREIIFDLYKDLYFRMTKVGGHIFSNNYDKNLGEKIFEILNLNNDKNKKILVAYTSSEDEMAAVTMNSQVFKMNLKENDAFNSQLCWIKKIISYVNYKKNEFQLIIRIHPRSLRNASEMKAYKDYLKNIKLENVRIVYPEEKISSFNLAEIADLALVSWSSISLELTRLGIPVLSGCQSNVHIFPKQNMNNFQFTNNERDYFEKINLMIQSKPNIDEFIRNLRWCCYLYLGNTVSLPNFNHNYIKNNKIKNKDFVAKLLKNDACVVEEIIKSRTSKNINKKDIYFEKKNVLENLKNLTSFFNNFSNSRLQKRIKQIF